MKPPIHKQKLLKTLLLIGTAGLGGCAQKLFPPDITYDDFVPAVQAAEPPSPVQVVELPKPLPLPGQLKPVPGAKAPKLITRAMLRQMRPGSVLVDIAIDQGGCAETSRPTTHHDPVYVEEGVTHYCVANMPGAYARTATQALTNVTYRYIELLADLGLAEACEKQPAILGGINTMNGQLTHQVVAQAHGISFTKPSF